MSEQKNQNLEIEINEQTADGIYSNLAMINHSPTEFIVDFIQIMPGVPKARVKSRVILTPQHAKRLAGALIDNVRKFEGMFGEIVENAPANGQGGTAMPFGQGGEA